MFPTTQLKLDRSPEGDYPLPAKLGFPNGRITMITLIQWARDDGSKSLIISVLYRYIKLKR